MVKEHAEEGMDVPMLRADCEVAYVTKLVRFARDVKTGRRANICLGFCMLPWLHHVLPFFDGSTVGRSAAEFEHWHRKESKSPFFVKWRNREFFLVPPVKKRLL